MKYQKGHMVSSLQSLIILSYKIGHHINELNATPFQSITIDFKDVSPFMRLFFWWKYATSNRFIFHRPIRIGDFKMPDVCLSVSVCVRSFVMFCKTLSVSFTFEDILTKFGDNVYAYKNMPAKNLRLILKNKMAATVLFCFPIFLCPFSLAVSQPQFSQTDRHRAF